MKRFSFPQFLVAALIAIFSYHGCAAKKIVQSDYRLKPVSCREVEITDSFWQPIRKTVREVTLPYLIGLAEESGQTLDARIVEAASYFLAENPDLALQQRIENAFDKMIERMRRLKGKWPSTGDGTMGRLGTFAQAATAYYEATGNRKLLDVTIECSDDLERTFGPSTRHDISNHEGVKMGLISLFRVTRDEKYVRLAKFLLDERGNAATGRILYGEYAQDHMPIKLQNRAIGHCVRATYLYNALTDIAALTGDLEYAEAAEHIWEDAVTKRTYITGGIGSYRDHEDYGDDYDLPNLACWNEICAAVGNTWWNHKLFLLRKEAKFMDVAERILYNGLLAGVSISGNKFLYQTPLKTYSNFSRQPQFGPNCCPPNITRFLASLGTLIYATEKNGIYINLYIGSRATIKLKDLSVAIEQMTNYPWEGLVKIKVSPDREKKFPIFFRIPGWARGEAMPGGLYRFLDEAEGAFSININGQPVPYMVEKGLAKIERKWKKGDLIELHWPMPVQMVVADDRVADDQGMVALQRGPLVYCAEGIDNGGKVFNLLVPEKAEINYIYRPDLLDGIGTISGKVFSLERGQDGIAVDKKEHELVAIPFYAFGNRGPSEMAVWLARQESRAELPPVPSIASSSRASSSCGNGTPIENYPDHNLPTIAQRFYPNSQDGSGDIRAIADQLEPVNSEDGSSYFLRLRPQSGDKAWVQYDFTGPKKVASVEIYWKDDKQYCLLPKTWRLFYKVGDKWELVQTDDPYGVEKDRFNRVKFKPVTTTALRLEVILQGKEYKRGELGPPDANWLQEDIIWFEGGIIEWRVNEHIK